MGLSSSTVSSRDLFYTISCPPDKTTRFKALTNEDHRKKLDKYVLVHFFILISSYDCKESAARCKGGNFFKITGGLIY